MSQDCSLNQFIKHTETVESLMTRFHTFKLMMLEDYSLSGVTWSISDDLSYNIVNSCIQNITDKAICLGNSFGSIGLQQFHPVLARDKFYTPDLLFSNLSEVYWVEPLEILRKLMLSILHLFSIIMFNVIVILDILNYFVILGKPIMKRSMRTYRMWTVRCYSL